MHGFGQSASTRAPMFDSLAHDGVKRPGTLEMTALLAALMALNSLAIDAMVPVGEHVATRAYFIHLEDGGDPLENWLRAERELVAA